MTIKCEFYARTNIIRMLRRFLGSRPEGMGRGGGREGLGAGAHKTPFGSEGWVGHTSAAGGMGKKHPHLAMACCL